MNYMYVYTLIHATYILGGKEEDDDGDDSFGGMQKCKYQLCKVLQLPMQQNNIIIVVVVKKQQQQILIFLKQMRWTFLFSWIEYKRRTEC